MAESREVLERVFREEAGVVQGALFAQLRDLDLVEDAFQDAVAAALEHWPREGVPRRPGRVAAHRGAAQGARPAAPPRDAARQAGERSRSSTSSRARRRRLRTTRRFPTSGCG